MSSSQPADTPPLRIAIIGGGFSGLSLAYAVQKSLSNADAEEGADSVKIDIYSDATKDNRVDESYRVFCGSELDLLDKNLRELGVKEDSAI